MSDDIKTNIQLKVTEYFSHHTTLKKDNLAEFLENIDLSIFDSQDEREALWVVLCKNCVSNDNLPRDIVKKNLLAFIDSNEVYSPDQMLEDSVKKYISKSVIQQPQDQLGKPSSSNLEDYPYDFLIQLRKLLSLVSFDKNQSILLHDIESLLKKNTHITIDKDSLRDIITASLSSDSTEITFEQYITLVDIVNQSIQKSLKEINSNSVKKKAKMLSRNNANNTVIDYVYDENDTFDFGHLLDYITVIFEQVDNMTKVHQSICDNYEEADSEDKHKQLDFNQKYYNVIYGNIMTYINEMERTAKEQKAKMLLFKDSMFSEIKAIQKENQSLEDKIQMHKCPQLGDVSMVTEARDVIEKLEDDLRELRAIHDKTKKENLHLQREMINNDTLITSQNDKLEFADQQVNALKSKIIVLQKENETLNKNYTKLLNEINKDMFKARSNDKGGNGGNGEGKELPEEYKHLENMDHEQLIEYIIERDNYSKNIEEANMQLKKELIELEQSRKKVENKMIDNMTEISLLKSANIQLRNENDSLTFELDNFKHKKTGNALSSLLEDDDDDDNKPKNKDKNKLQSFIHNKICKTSAFTYTTLSIPQDKNLSEAQVLTLTAKNKRRRKNFDFLFLCMEQKIIISLDDIYYNSHTNIIFTEKIKYLTIEKATVNLILFITADYLYLFDTTTYEKYLTFPLIELTVMNVSTNNNFISLTFPGEIIIFETFRVLELIHFFKAIRKEYYEFSININNFNNQFLPKNKEKNYTNSPYYGKALLSGYLLKKHEGFLISFNEKFVVLSDIGMILMDEPYGKPSQVVNLLFSHMREYDDEVRKLFCFVITIGKKDKFIFGAKTEEQRKLWMDEIKKWVLITNNEYNNYDEFYLL